MAGVHLAHNINDETATKARAQIVAAMDRLESELQPSGYLVGEDFTVADLTAAPTLAPPILEPRSGPGTGSGPLARLSFAQP